MKKYTGFLLATAGGVAAASGAQTADLPMKGPAYAPPPPVANWAGWYVGLHAGAAHQDVRQDLDGHPYGTNFTSFIGGGQIGYNWQKGYYVFGVEFDGSGLTRDRDRSDNYFSSYGGNIPWLFTARARTGLALADTLVYVTGGLAVGEVTSYFNDFGTVYENNHTRVGWTIGAGVEHMWAPNWTVALEALYVDLGRFDRTTNIPEDELFMAATAMIGRVKINYKFR
jgi:outer membrane immunogenic protein